MTVVNQKRNLNRGSSKQEADHHAEMLPSAAWLMTMLQSKITTVCIVATCSRRGPDLEPSITSEIAYYTHVTVITQNRQWKYLLRPTPSNLAITHHHQLLFLWAPFLSKESVKTEGSLGEKCFFGGKKSWLRTEGSWEMYLPMRVTMGRGRELT